MNIIKIPTSKDISIEIDGRRVAVVESYKASSKRELYRVEECGSSLPVKTVSGQELHRLELKRIYFIGESRQDFYSLSDFTVVIAKPDCRIVYAGCEWESIAEGVNLSEPCVETMTVVAARRFVL